MGMLAGLLSSGSSGTMSAASQMAQNSSTSSQQQNASQPQQFDTSAGMSSYMPSQQQSPLTNYLSYLYRPQ